MKLFRTVNNEIIRENIGLIVFQIYTAKRTIR